MRYCPRCVLPETRPNISFDDNGHCNCSTLAKKQTVDWKARETAFKALASRARSTRADWDCIVPVSGGKDSTWQVVTCLKHGLKPLCVTWRTPARTRLGQSNLDNLISLGVDHFDVSMNPKVERIFTLKAFEKVGSPAVPMHMALFAIPLNLAIRFRIPLVLWGENSAVEYGGSHKETQGFAMTRAWLERYGATGGTVAENWIDEELSVRDVQSYCWPDDTALRDAQVNAVFLGQYFPWDPAATYEIARNYGFKGNDKPLTGYYRFADVDDSFLVIIHHWLKWYKFGFTRLWDNLSLEIRNNRVTRDEAIALIAQRGDETPYKAIDAFCRYAQISQKQFFEIAERFRNNRIWSRDTGTWRINDFLIRDWSWQ